MQQDVFPQIYLHLSDHHLENAQILSLKNTLLIQKYIELALKLQKERALIIHPQIWIFKSTIK